MMNTEPIYLRQAENGKLKRIRSLSEADYICVAKNQYISHDVWINLVDKYMRLTKGDKDKTEENDSVEISREEYNGFLKMKRVLKDRSLQQIDKAKADEHGYTLKYAEMRSCDDTYHDRKAYLVSKITPISIKIDLETAAAMIISDLKDYYGYVDSIFKSSIYFKTIYIKTPDLLVALKQRQDPSYNYDFYRDNSEDGRILKELLDQHPSAISFGPIKISSNIGQGVYEVTYWASAPI